MWASAITAMGGWVFEVFKGKQEITKAKVKGAIERAQRWEDRMAEGSVASWKDEYYTILLSIPMVLCFFPDMVPHVKAGFAALDEMPDWYRWALMLSIGASFGFRGFEKFNLSKTTKPKG